MAAMVALVMSGLTACKNDSKNDDDEETYSVRKTLNGKTFVCESYDNTVVYNPAVFPDGWVDYSKNGGNPYRKEIEIYKNYFYFTGTSDKDCEVYVWDVISERYVKTFASYSIDGSTITFTSAGSESKAIIIDDTSFKIEGSVSYAKSGDTVRITYTDSDMVFRQASAPSSGSKTVTYE